MPATSSTNDGHDELQTGQGMSPHLHVNIYGATTLRYHILVEYGGTFHIILWAPYINTTHRLHIGHYDEAFFIEE